MLPGYNTDFAYRGQTFHVQTEDSGVANPVVVSLLYYKGAILASRKTSYRELLGDAGCDEQVKTIMKKQHKALMRELLAGSHDEKIPAASIASGDSEDGSRGDQPALDEATTRYREEQAAAAGTAR